MNENRLYSSRRVTIPAAFAAAVLAGCQPNVSERDLNPADTPDIVELIDRSRTVLVDARTPSKFTAGHIPGATNLNIADVNLDRRNLPDLIAAETIIVYGQNPGDSLATGLALRLLEAGYDATRIYRGGVEAWTASGGELVTTQP